MQFKHSLQMHIKRRWIVFSIVSLAVILSLFGWIWLNFYLSLSIILYENPNKYPHRYRNAALIEIQYSLFRTWIQCLSSCRLFNLKFSIYYCLHMVSFRENAWNIAITSGLWYIYMWCDPICGYGFYCRSNFDMHAIQSTPDHISCKLLPGLINFSNFLIGSSLISGRNTAIIIYSK